MGCGGSRQETETGGIPISFHSQRNNNNIPHDQNKAYMEEEEDSIKSFIISEDSSTPKFKHTQRQDQETGIQTSHEQDYEDEDDLRKINGNSSPSFKVYLSENPWQEKERDGEHGGSYVCHEFQERMEKEEMKKGVLKKRISKYRVMLSKRWR